MGGEGGGRTGTLGEGGEEEVSQVCGEDGENGGGPRARAGGCGRAGSGFKPENRFPVTHE